MDLNKIWESLTLSNDFMFSKVMRDKEICRETLEILLDKKIGEINYIENQKAINITYDSKSIRLDVYVEDEKRVYNIEMQVVNKRDLAKRSRYYQGMIDLNAIEKGQIYEDLKESIVIFICKFDPFGYELPTYTFENICIENTELYLKDGTTKIFFNTKAYSKETRKDLESFLEYLEKNRLNDNDFIRKIEDKIRRIKENKDWRIEFMTLYMKEQEIARENLKKGIEIGREEGLAKGREEGIEIGREEGLAKGREEGIGIGRAKGIEQERTQGIKTLIEAYRELGIEEDIILGKLVEKYNLIKEDAEKYLK